MSKIGCLVLRIKVSRWWAEAAALKRWPGPKQKCANLYSCWLIHLVMRKFRRAKRLAQTLNKISCSLTLMRACTETSLSSSKRYLSQQMILITTTCSWTGWSPSQSSRSLKMFPYSQVATLAKWRSRSQVTYKICSWKSTGVKVKRKMTSS